MADVKVNGRIKIKTFQANFIEKFPYIVPTLRTEDGKAINNDFTIASARSKALGGYSPSGESELSINGNLTVGGFEKRFKDAFGVDCEICYKTKGGRLMRTNSTHDKQTLASFNANLEKEGYEKIVL